MNVVTLRIPQLADLLDDVQMELLNAREKFPANKMMVHALNEEVGELWQEMLNQYHDKDAKRNKEIYKEAIQVICMAIRVAIEGDADFPYHPPKPGFYAEEMLRKRNQS